MSGPGAQLWSRNYDLVALELPAWGEMFYRFRDSFKSPVLAESFRLFLIVFIHLFIFLMAFWSLLGEPFQACPARRRPPGKTQDSLGRLYLSAGLGTIWYQPTEIGAPKTLAQISGRGSEERWMDGILHLSLLFYMKISGCKHSGSFPIYISCLCAVWVVLTNHIWPGLGCMQVKLSM